MLFTAGLNDQNVQGFADLITRSQAHYIEVKSMTFVGWDDEIQYDFNDDGKFTNDQDINGDGKVDLRDWEKGALIMVNSWGIDWGNGGKAFVMYKLLAETVENGGIQSNKPGSKRPVFCL